MFVFAMPTSGIWFNMAAPLCIYINDKDTQNIYVHRQQKITSIYILIDNLPQKFPFVNNLHAGICFSKINYVM